MEALRAEVLRAGRRRRRRRRTAAGAATGRRPSLHRDRRPRRADGDDRARPAPRAPSPGLQVVRRADDREFGPGISAVVGPNGSGKSNLADALRWSLGEQGRALRSRKSEDVIFAGSEKRSALGMADVTLVLDNADGLLPVDYSRPGARPPPLPQRRERLPPEQAADPAARPRRPARRGPPRRQRLPVHRPGHGRPGTRAAAGGAAAALRGGRRRPPPRAPAAQGGGAAGRVRGEPRPGRGHPRRAPAAGPAARGPGGAADDPATAGDELPSALLARRPCPLARGGRAGRPSPRRGWSASDTRPIGRWPSSQAAEEAAAAIAAELGERAAAERERLAEHEAARTAVTELRLRDTRLAGDREAIERDLRRVGEEREAADASLAVQRRALALPLPPRDHDLDAARRRGGSPARRGERRAGVARGGEPGTGRGGGRDPSSRGRARRRRRRPHGGGSRRRIAGWRRSGRPRTGRRATGGARRAAGGCPGRRRGRRRRPRRPPSRALAEAAPRRPMRMPGGGPRRSGKPASRRPWPRNGAPRRDRGPASARTRSGGSPGPRGDTADGAWTTSSRSIPTCARRSRRRSTSWPGRTSSIDGRGRPSPANAGMLVDPRTRRRAATTPGRGDPTVPRSPRDAGGSLLADAIRRDPSRTVGPVLARAAVVDDLPAAPRAPGRSFRGLDARDPGWRRDRH